MKQVMEVVFAGSVIVLGCALVFRNTDIAMTTSGVTILSYIINTYQQYYGRE